MAVILDELSQLILIAQNRKLIICSMIPVNTDYKFIQLFRWNMLIQLLAVVLNESLQHFLAITHIHKINTELVISNLLKQEWEILLIFPDLISHQLLDKIPGPLVPFVRCLGIEPPFGGVLLLNSVIEPALLIPNVWEQI